MAHFVGGHRKRSLRDKQKKAGTGTKSFSCPVIFYYRADQMSTNKVSQLCAFPFLKSKQGFRVEIR